MAKDFNQRMWAGSLLLAAFALTVAASMAALLVPAYSDGATTLQNEGAKVVVLVLVPVAIAALGLHSHRRRSTKGLLACTVTMVAFVAVTGFSLGLYFAPAALLLLFSAILTAG